MVNVTWFENAQEKRWQLNKKFLGKKFRHLKDARVVIHYTHVDIYTDESNIDNVFEFIEKNNMFSFIAAGTIYFPTRS